MAMKYANRAKNRPVVFKIQTMSLAGFKAHFIVAKTMKQAVRYAELVHKSDEVHINDVSVMPHMKINDSMINITEGNKI